MKTSKRVFLTAALFALATGVAFADGDGGDNSMNPYTGESYAAFYGGNVGGAGNVGDFVTARERQATALTPAEEPATQEMVATLDRHGHPQNAFRDDTAC